MQLYELRQNQSLPLEAKIIKSQQRIREPKQRYIDEVWPGLQPTG